MKLLFSVSKEFEDYHCSRDNSSYFTRVKLFQYDKALILSAVKVADLPEVPVDDFNTYLPKIPLVFSKLDQEEVEKIARVLAEKLFLDLRKIPQIPKTNYTQTINLIKELFSSICTVNSDLDDLNFNEKIEEARKINLDNLELDNLKLKEYWFSDLFENTLKRRDLDLYLDLREVRTVKELLDHADIRALSAFLKKCESLNLTEPIKLIEKLRKVHPEFNKALTRLELNKKKRRI